MTHSELTKKFEEAVRQEPELDDHEWTALSGMYHSMLFDKKHELQISLDEQILKIAGVIEFLAGCGKIRNDENLWMLMNEIEAEEAET